MELEPYTPERRDAVERQLSKKANKRELIEEQRAELLIRVFWLKLTNQISMQLIAEGSPSREFMIPNAEVLVARDHPEVYAGEAGMLRTDMQGEPM